MTMREASLWNAASAMREDFYHGTAVKAATAIRSSGFHAVKTSMWVGSWPPTIRSRGFVYPRGVNITAEAHYAEMLGCGVLRLAVNVSKVATWPQTEEIVKYADSRRKSVESIAQGAGFDALQYLDFGDLGEGKQVVTLIFDARNITVVGGFYRSDGEVTEAWGEPGPIPAQLNPQQRFRRARLALSRREHHPSFVNPTARASPSTGTSNAYA